MVDAALEVHRHLGPAFGEVVYEAALAHELELRGVAFRRQVVVPVDYKGVCVGEGRVDVLVGESLIVELKALPALLPVHTSQALSYIKATGLTLALLLNFGDTRIKYGIRRIALTG